MNQPRKRSNAISGVKEFETEYAGNSLCDGYTYESDTLTLCSNRLMSDFACFSAVYLISLNVSDGSSPVFVNIVVAWMAHATLLSL